MAFAGMILLSYIAIIFGFLALIGSAVAYYLDSEHYRHLLAAGVTLVVAGLMTIAVFLAGF